VEVFQKAGQNPQMIRITDIGKAPIWKFQGEIVTNRGFHIVVQNGDRIYDKIAGPNGMLKAEYLKLLWDKMRVCPVLEEGTF